MTESQQGFSAFISHASHDRETAEAICTQLEETGFRCFIAPRDIRPGKEYGDEIVRGIEQSKCLVLVLSAKANESTFVRAEVERAYSKGKPVFPIRIEEVLPSRALELFVSTQHWIDAWAGNLSDHAQKLAIELARDPDYDLDLPPDVVRSAKMRRWLRIGGIGAMSLATAVIVGLLMRTGGGDPEGHSVEGFVRPPQATLMGGSYRGNAPAATRVILADGFDENGPVNVFKNEVSFKVFSLNSGTPKEIYESKPSQFKGNYQVSNSFSFNVDKLPVRLVSCLVYVSTEDDKTRASIQGYNLTRYTYSYGGRQSQTGSVRVNTFGPVSTVDMKSKSACLSAAQSYAKEHLKGVPPLKDEIVTPSGPLGGTKEQLDNAQIALGFYSGGFSIRITAPGKPVAAYPRMSVLMSFDGKAYRNANFGQETRFHYSQPGGSERNSIPDFVFLKLQDSDKPVKKKVPFDAGFKNYLNGFDGTKKRALACTETYCYVHTEIACAPFLAEVRLNSKKHGSTKPIPISKCIPNGDMKNACAAFPWNMPVLPAGDQVSASFTLVNGSSFESKPTRVIPLTRVLRQGLSTRVFNFGVRRASRGNTPKWVRLPALETQGNQQNSPPIYFGLDHNLNARFLFGVLGLTRFDIKCRTAKPVKSVYVNFDGRGEMLWQQRFHGSNVTTNHSVTSFSDKIGFSFEFEDGTKLGPVSYKFDSEKLVEELAPGSETIKFRCIRNICGMSSYRPSGLIVWRHVKSVTYGPTASDLTHHEPIDISVPNVLRKMAAKQRSRQFPEIKIPSDWKDFFYFLTLKDGSKTRTMRLKLRN